MSGIVIIVSGFAGSGKSTLAQNLAEELEMRCIHASGILREIIETGDVCEEGAGKNVGWWETDAGREALEERLKDGSMDKCLDEKLLEIVEEGNVVLDSWTMPWLSAKGFKIWIDTSLEERARRVAERDGISEKKAFNALKERDEKTAKIYKKLYGFELGKDFNPFDAIIKSDGKSAEEVLEEALDAIKRNHLI